MHCVLKIPEDSTATLTGLIPAKDGTFLRTSFPAPQFLPVIHQMAKEIPSFRILAEWDK